MWSERATTPSRGSTSSVSIPSGTAPTANLCPPPTARFRSATSSPAGGSPLRPLVDQWLGAYDVVWAAAGHPHTVFPTSFAELVRITGGTPADVGAGAVDAVPPAR